MNLHQISAVVGGSMAGKEARIQGVTTDSRSDCSGKLFVALKGEFYNGEDYCQDAVAKGAAAVLVSNAVEVDVPQLIVKDTLVALQAIASAWIKQTGVKVIGVTGSNGKTTVKNMLYSVLSQKYKCFSTPGNFNNEVGVPLSLLSVSSEDEVAIIEMGASRIGDIAKLTEIIKPDVALVTNIGEAHIGKFGSVDNIATGKAEIYEALDPFGLAVVNADCKYVDDFKSKIKGNSISFGHYQDSDFRLIKVQNQYHVLSRRGESFVLKLPVLGFHNYMNATAVLIIGLTLKLSSEQILKGLEEFKPEPGRLELFQTKTGLTVIDDSYNANPTSVEAAIDVLSTQKKPQRLIIGDMAELGDSSKHSHQAVGSYAAEKNIDAVFAIGEFADEVKQGFAKEGCETFNNVSSLTEELDRQKLQKGSLLIKGSRSMRLERVVKHMVGGKS